MAQRPARTLSSAPQGCGASHRHSFHLSYCNDETSQAPARTGAIVQAWPENGPSTVLAVGAANYSNGDLSNPHASRGTPAQTKRRGVRCAVPLYQGTGANSWGSSLYRVLTIGSSPPATDAATAAPRGLAPNVQGEPPP